MKGWKWRERGLAVLSGDRERHLYQNQMIGGWSAHDEGQFDKARPYYRRSTHTTRGGNTHFWNYGRAANAQKNYQSRNVIRVFWSHVDKWVITGTYCYLFHPFDTDGETLTANVLQLLICLPTQGGFVLCCTFQSTEAHERLLQVGPAVDRARGCVSSEQSGEQRTGRRFGLCLCSQAGFEQRSWEIHQTASVVRRVWR